MIGKGRMEKKVTVYTLYMKKPLFSGNVDEVISFINENDLLIKDLVYDAENTKKDFAKKKKLNVLFWEHKLGKKGKQSVIQCQK